MAAIKIEIDEISVICRSEKISDYIVVFREKV